MANDARIVLQQRLSQQLVMTPQLRQAIKILQVSRAELETLVDQELTENPLLEEQVEEKAEDAVPTVDSQTGTEDWQANGEAQPAAQAAPRARALPPPALAPTPRTAPPRSTAAPPPTPPPARPPPPPP